MNLRSAIALAATLAAASPASSGAPTGDTARAAEEAGRAVFEAACANCHGGTLPGAPSEALLAEVAPDALEAAMTTGAMRVQAAALDGDERALLIAYLRRNQPPTQPARVLECTAGPFTGEALRPATTGWGFDLENTRSLSREQAGIGADSVGRLQLRWAFAYPNANRARSQPLVVGSLVVVGSQDGTVYALDRASGCVRWRFRASAEVRNGVTPLRLVDEAGSARWAGVFSDLQARAYAVDLSDGSLIWKRALDEHPAATGTGQAAVHDGVAYFPVSSVEVGTAADPTYECCTFRGAVVALNGATGELIWRRYTTLQAPQPTDRNRIGTQRYGPSGAPAWGTPTIDAARGQLYLGTGENYSDPAETTSDAILAIGLADGALRWTMQGTAGDVWNAACIEGFGDPANCPRRPGPDYDFGAAPMLVSGNDGDVVIAGQKSGVIWGIDPDDGNVRWQQKIGRGGILGGVHFGMAAGAGRVYAPINDSDIAWTGSGEAQPGITALDPASGERLWQATPRPADCAGRAGCEAGFSAPISLIGDLVFAGNGEGTLIAYDAASGQERWRYDTARSFQTVSGDTARGGGFSGGTGPVAADGWLFVNSGYYMVLNPKPGNVLLAFELAGEAP